ncbi:MAG: hypothetical protein OXJ52_03995 [Oligoflexia bacterium]|nr:hypothetical protein [Oligoflexia bacterium]
MDYSIKNFQVIFKDGASIKVLPPPLRILPYSGLRIGFIEEKNLKNSNTIGINRRAFILNSFLPLFYHYLPIKQTAIITSKNQIFPNILAFRNALIKVTSNNNYELLNKLCFAREQGIIIKENRTLISNNKMKFERFWISKKAYDKWIMSNSKKKSDINLVKSQDFLITEKSAKLLLFT